MIPWSGMPLLGREALLKRARAAYQQEIVDQEHALTIQHKYQALQMMVQAPASPSPEQWKSLTSRYPGILREAEMCAPTTIQARAKAAKNLQSWTGRTRAELLQDPPHRAILYWHDAHHLLRDILTWRIRPNGEAKDLTSFYGWTKHNASSPFWPEAADLLEGSPKGRPSQRTAYQWLAQLSDQSEASLMRLLVERVGTRMSSATS